MLPRSVAEVGNHYANLQAGIAQDALSDLQAPLRRGRKSPEAWRDAVQSAARAFLTLQLTAATYADAYLNDVLDAQGASADADGRVDPRAFVDLADGGGSWLQSLVFAPNSVRPSNGDWTRFDFVANSIVKTGLSDTARWSVQSGMQARPAVKGYTRILRGASCARCAILAGRRYRSATAFRRHNRCDCQHAPYAGVGDGWETEPKTYFRSLSTEDQDRLFTKSGAEAIRRGADISQVVNASKGIEVAQSFGRTARVTTEGTTRRGIAGQRLQGAPRLLPDEIFLQAERLGWDRTEVLAQLRRFAYVI